jgi:large subunit ribosomal protein L10
MTRTEKSKIIDDIKNDLTNSSFLYIVDTFGLNAEQTAALRRSCFESNVKLKVVKNTLLKLAMKDINGEFDQFDEVLKGPTAIMLSDVANAPAKVIESFRKGSEKPVLKAAYVEESFYFGDDQLKALASLKSKDELLGDIIMLLQSPMKNVVSSLDSAKHTLAGLVKTLSEKEA